MGEWPVKLVKKPAIVCASGGYLWLVFVLISIRSLKQNAAARNLLKGNGEDSFGRFGRVRARELSFAARSTMWRRAGSLLLDETPRRRRTHNLSDCEETIE